VGAKEITINNNANKKIKKRRVLFLFFLISLGMIFSFSINNVSAAEWNVTPGGSIQNTINGASANDTINVFDNASNPYTYKENLIINKTLEIKANGNVTVQSLNASQPVIVIDSGGSGSTITGLTITDTSGSSLIALNGANNCNIIGDIITSNNNENGIEVLSSNNNIISGNSVTNNANGIIFYNSSGNTITKNQVTSNQGGVSFELSNNNTISGNNLTDNIYYGEGGWNGDGINMYECFNNTISGNNISGNACGISLQTVSVNMHYNSIINNTNYALTLYDNTSNVNATDNWWGTNNDPQTSGMFWNGESGTIIYNPWLILTTSIDKTQIPDKTGKSLITAYLNQDSNNNTAAGTVPVGTPVYFSVNPSSMGTLVATSGITNSGGNASTTFNAGSISGPVALNVTVDGVTVQMNINLINYPPVLNFIGNKTINENQLLNFKVTGSDPNDDSLTYSVSGLPKGASFNKSKDVFKWTPTYNQSGVYDVTFTVSDGKLNNKETIKITVKNVDIFENNIKISNKGSEKIFYDYKLTIKETNGKIYKKTISGYLNAKTSRNVSCGSYKAKTKIGILEDIYNKAKVKKNIDITNQIIIANKVIYTQRVQKPMVTPSPDNIQYPVKF